MPLNTRSAGSLKFVSVQKQKKLWSRILDIVMEKLNFQQPLIFRVSYADLIIFSEFFIILQFFIILHKFSVFTVTFD